MQTCSSCGSKWIFLPGDAHCPMCGAQIPFVLVSLENKPNLFEDEPESTALTLVIHNVHGSPITVTKISDSHSCISVRSPFNPIAVQPDARAMTEVHYSRPESVSSDEFPLTVTIKVLSRDGDMDREDTCDLMILPAPQVLAHEPAVMLTAAVDSKVVTKRIVCAFNEIAAELFREVWSPNETPWLQDVDADPEGQVLTLRVRPDKLTPGEEASVTVSVNLVGHRPILLPVSVCLAPLQFTRTDYVILTEQVRWLDLPIKNVSQKALEINSARVESVLQEDNVFTFDPDQFRIEHPSIIPFEPQQELDKQGHIRLRVNSFRLVSGTYKATIVYRLDTSDEDLRSTLTLQVVEAPPDTGLLAIDFGTSNTCCAHIDTDTTESTLIALDEEDTSRKSIPSLIALRGSDECLIGPDAKTPTAEFAALLKLKLGKDKPVLRDFSARQLLFFFVREVIWKAERQLNRKIQRLILTHPSRFTNREIDDYRWIVIELKKIYPNLIWRLIDEASAAVLNFIPSLTQKGDCSFFMFDFGGGTIDMTFCDLISRETPKKVRLKNMGGLRRFGGQDINALLLDMVVHQFQSILIEKSPGQLARKDISVPYTMTDLDSFQQKVNDREVFSALKVNLDTFESDYLERMKVDLCKEDRPQDFRYVLRALLKTGKLETLNETIHINQQQFVQSVRARMHQAVETMQKIIRESEDDGRGSLGSGGSSFPDVIILVGGSCRMSRPDIVEIMSNAFPGSEIIRSEDPDALKACVVQGACLYGKQILLGRTIIELIGFDGARSSFGYADLDDHFRTVFKAVVKKGRPLPATSEFRRMLEEGNVITLLENFGFDTVLDNNSDIETIGKFALDARDHPVLSKKAPEAAQLSLTVNEDESILLEIVVTDDNSAGSKNEERISFIARERQMNFTGR